MNEGQENQRKPSLEDILKTRIIEFLSNYLIDFNRTNFSDVPYFFITDM